MFSLVFDQCFPCSHSSEGSLDEVTQEAIGETKPTVPPFQMVADYEDDTPNPSPREARVVVTQKTPGGPSESPSEHVSCFLLSSWGSPRALFGLFC